MLISYLFNESGSEFEIKSLYEDPNYLNLDCNEKLKWMSDRFNIACSIGAINIVKLYLNDEREPEVKKRLVSNNDYQSLSSSLFQASYSLSDEIDYIKVIEKLIENIDDFKVVERLCKSNYDLRKNDPFLPKEIENFLKNPKELFNQIHCKKDFFVSKYLSEEFKSKSLGK